jgi:hypothetical protein
MYPVQSVEESFVAITDKYLDVPLFGNAGS